MKRKFKIGNSYYEIPDAEVSAFLQENPDAVEVRYYELGGQKYNIPLSEVDAFESDMGLKKKEASAKPSADMALQSADAGAQLVGGISNMFQSPSPSGSESGGTGFDLGITALPLQYSAAPPKKTPAEVARNPQPGFTETFLSKVTGQPNGAFSLIPTKEQNKEYADIEEAAKKRVEEKASEVSFKASRGIVSAQELEELYQDPNGRQYVNGIIQAYVPESFTENPAAIDWNNIARTIKTKNRPQAIADLDKQNAASDQEITNLLATTFAEKVTVTGSTGGAGVAISKVKIDPFDLNDPSQYAAAFARLNNADRLVDANGNLIKGAKEKLLGLLQDRAQRTTMALSEPDAEIESLSDKLKDAIARVNIDRERGEKIATEDFAKEDQANLDHVKVGLAYAKIVDPAKYKNVVRSVSEKGRMADSDFELLGRIGQNITNEKNFREAANNPELLDTETGIDYTTRQSKKAMYAGAIGEYLKDQGFTNKSQFSKEMIKRAAQVLGLPNADIVNELAQEEQIVGYDAIPKSGLVEGFIRGTMTPFEGIRKTVRSFVDDESETYLKTQQYDIGIGGQKVADAKGELSTRLPSDRGNVWYDVFEGFGQFVPQVLLTRGIGGAISRGVNAGITSAAPRAALTSSQSAAITNFGGTFISTYLQEYGNSYEEALQKTGDVKTARAMGAINGAAAAAFELWLPDTKIADRAAGIFRKNYAGDILDAIRKGGNVDEIARRGRSIVEKFVGETISIGGQEVAEEGATNLTNYITESIFSPRTAADRNLSEELLETARATALSMLIPSVLGGAGSARRNSDFTVNGLHASAIDFEGSRSALDKALIEDQIDQQQYNNGIKMLSTHRESIGNAPTQSSSGKILSESERLEFAYQDTLIKSYNEQMENATSDVVKEDIQRKIDNAKNIQRQILMPETVTEQDKQDDTWRRRVLTLEQEAADIDGKAELTEQEQAAVDALGGLNTDDSVVKPYLDTIQNPDSTVEEKRIALRGLSDQLTAPGTEARVGTALGRAAEFIYDLGYPAPQETAALKEVHENAPTEITNPQLLAAMRAQGIIPAEDQAGEESQDISPQQKAINDLEQRRIDEVARVGRPSDEIDPIIREQKETEIANINTRYEAELKALRTQQLQEQNAAEQTGIKVYEYNGKRYEVKGNEVVEEGTDILKPLDFKDELLSKGELIETKPVNAVKVGDSVQWTSQGVDQFAEPRRVTSISEDGKFATVEGSNTGVPVEQLSIVGQQPPANSLASEMDAIENWRQNSDEYEDYFIDEWDGESLSLYKDRDTRMAEFTRKELIELGVDIPEVFQSTAPAQPVSPETNASNPQPQQPATQQQRSSIAVTMPQQQGRTENRGRVSVTMPAGQQTTNQDQANLGEESGLQEVEQNEGQQVAAPEGQQEQQAQVKQPRTEFARNAKSLAERIRQNGLRSVLPEWTKADVRDGDQLQGFGGKALDEAIATAIDIVANAVDAGAQLVDAIQQGFEHLRDYYSQNTRAFNEARVRGEFERNIRGMFERVQNQNRSEPGEDTGKEKNFNFFKNRDISLSGEKAEFLSKQTLEYSGTEVTQPFDYDVKELDGLLSDGKRWIDDAKMEFNRTPVEYATRLFRDLRAMRGRMAVKAVGMVSLMNSIDLDLRYSALTDGERGTLRQVRTALELEIAKNAREGSLTLNAQRLIHKLYRGEYKTGEVMEGWVGKDAQNMAEHVVSSLKTGTEDLTEPGRAQTRRANRADPPPRKPRPQGPKQKKAQEFKSEMTEDMKKKAAELKKQVADLANKVNCRKNK